LAAYNNKHSDHKRNNSRSNTSSRSSRRTRKASLWVLVSKVWIHLMMDSTYLFKGIYLHIPFMYN